MSRVVMYVYNEAMRDSRVLREAATLAAAGHEVTLVAQVPMADPAVVQRLPGDGFEIVRVPVPRHWRETWTLFRYPWRGRHRLLGLLRDGIRRPGPATARAIGAVAVAVAVLPWIAVRAASYLVSRRAGRASRGDDAFDWLARWRWGILGWAHAAATAAPPADVHHGHDLTGLAAAVEAARRDRAILVYDSHELFMESGSNAGRPRWAKFIVGSLERRWARRAAALVTVNHSIAERLSRRFGIAWTVVVHNAPPRWTPPDPPPDLLREAAGIPAGEPVLLYHGRFAASRGLETIVDALRHPELERAHAVFLGFGPLRDELLRHAEEPDLHGRLHVLDAVPPDELTAWVASADVGLMPNLPLSDNETLSTPNKLFESLAAGVPVVTSDFPERRAIVLGGPDGPLGAVCDPTDPADLARAAASILALDPPVRAELRERCLRAAHERWNWETESARLVDLYDELAGEAGRRA